MILTMMKGKLHRATVTEANLDYEGSVAIDVELMKLAGLLPNEQVDIYNCDNGERFTTYVIKGNAGDICIQGAAAHKVAVGDRVIIVAYAQMEQAVAEKFIPNAILLGEDNKPKGKTNADKYLAVV